MKTEWDYTNLADAYLKRPDYAETALEKMLIISKMGGQGAPSVMLAQEWHI